MTDPPGRDGQFGHDHNPAEGLGAVRLSSARRSVEAARPSDVIFPKRKSLRAEDVVAHPWIGDILRRWWTWWETRLGAMLWFLKRWWVVVAALLVTVGLVHFGRAQLEARREADRIAAIRRRAERDVHDLLAIVGHGIRVSSVRVVPLPPYVGGSYETEVQVVSFNSTVGWPEPELLYVAGHECVHALFYQAGLSRYGNGIESQVLEESTAVVLGAHLAGRVYSRRGHDGAWLTKEIVTSFRSMCSRDNPSSPGARIMREFLQGRFREVDPGEVEMVVSHFGNEHLVTALDTICRQHRDPWDAAHEVFRRFKMGRKWGGPDLGE
ncbi:MAG: hypothetical protein GXP47_05150 [Acidobacteria bacterium]|nr:hypothetical protein [Acidobacteriota bacterium]